MDNEEALVANLHAHHHVRVFQRDAGRAALLAQLAANIALDIHGAETVLTRTLAAHGEDFTWQLIGEVPLALFQHVIEVTQRVFVDLQKMGNARRAA